MIYIIPGHTDVVMGLISLNRADVYERLRFFQSGKALLKLELLKSDNILILSKQLFFLWHGLVTQDQKGCSVLVYFTSSL